MDVSWRRGSLIGLAAVMVAACASPDMAPSQESAMNDGKATTAHTAPPRTDEYLGETLDPHAGNHDAVDDWPREHRLAFMMGHVEAGLALYRAGAPEMAAPHLLHPVSETHASEREGLAELGFDASLFEAVSEALEAGRPAVEVESQLQAAEANLRDVARKAGGDAVGTIRFLMDVIDEEYAIALTDGAVTDPGEYQDAYGFAVVARQQSMRLPLNVRAPVTPQIDRLIALWPDDGPIPPAEPASVESVTALTTAIRDVLPAQP